MVLKSQLAQNQRALRIAQKGQHHRHRFVPPGQPAKIGLLHRKIAAGQVHAREHVANCRAVRSLRRQLTAAAQLVDHSRRLAFEPVQYLARPYIAQFGLAEQWCLVRGHLFAGLCQDGWRRRRRLRVGHGNAAAGQVFHELQVKRQLLKAQPFKQRQDILALVGVDKVVGVFDAACTSPNVLQLTQAQRFEESAGLVK